MRDTARDKWRNFPAPLVEVATNVWEIVDGPPVRLVLANKNAIQTLILKVKSLKQAETFLSEKGMLGALKEGQIRIAPEKIYGLDVRLVE